MNYKTEFLYKIRMKLHGTTVENIPIFDAILDKLIEKASNGDISAIKLILEWSNKVDLHERDIIF